MICSQSRYRWWVLYSSVSSFTVTCLNSNMLTKISQDLEFLKLFVPTRRIIFDGCLFILWNIWWPITSTVVPEKLDTSTIRSFWLNLSFKTLFIIESPDITVVSLRNYPYVTRFDYFSSWKLFSTGKLF